MLEARKKHEEYRKGSPTAIRKEKRRHRVEKMKVVKKKV
jgi:hypothetical protein